MNLSSTRLRRVVLGGIAALAVLPASSALATTPASASLAAPSAVPMVSVVTPAGSLTLTVTLKPSDAGAFATLLDRTRTMTTDQRAVALAAVEPTDAQRAAVTSSLQAAGFAVTPFGAWAVHATAPVATAVAAFQVSLQHVGTVIYPSADPAIPSDLAPLVSAVFGFDTRAKFHAEGLATATPAAATSGNNGYLPPAYLQAYRVPANGRGAGVSVATLQLAPWNPADLTTFAGKYLPGVTPNYTPISVDAGPASPASATDEGHIEVALDQETVLGQAPLAEQRAYFAPNTDQGFTDVILAMGADTAAHHIVSASSSWGECETDEPAASLVADGNAVTALVAGGATFFASAGDSGAYDCAADDMTGVGAASTTEAVDSPGSFPSAISAGGTSLNTLGPPPSEAAWSGGGGGPSVTFARPSYQSALKQAGTARLVPDLSANADPNTGTDVYDSEPYAPGLFFGGDTEVGGTSLASPLLASELAASVTSLNCTTGVGDIHVPLYKSTSVNDVTTGRNNGSQSATTGGFPAGVGYDEATGVGTPKWDLLIRDLATGTACANAAAAPSLPEVSSPALLAVTGLGMIGLMSAAATVRRRRANTTR